MNYSKKGVYAKQKELSSKSSKFVKKIILTCFKVILIAIVSVGICGVAAGIGAFKGILACTPNIRLSDVVASGQATIVYDCEGNALDQYVSTNSNRIEVTLDQVPKNLQLAFVALEDARFYDHNGIDVKGIVRAGYVFLASGGKRKEGASTITQQLLKNTIFTDWTSEGDNDIKQIKRKIQEQYLALEITKNFTKDEVLIRYLNAINLGQNTLGVEAASQRYFGKSCSELTLSECAVIASITQNPSRYNPLRHPENNKDRRKKCLNDMLDLNFITDAQYAEAMADTEDVYERIGLYDTHLQENNTTSGSYFSDAVYEQVLKDLKAAGYNDTIAGNLLTSGGLRIESTMDPSIQKIMDEEFENPDNFSPSVKWYLTYALTIHDANDEKHNFSKENMMTWFQSHVDKNFNLIFSSQDAAQEAIVTYRTAMLTELGVADEPANYEESISMTPQPQAAMVVQDQSTGYVVAMVGGRGTKEGRRTLNRAMSSTRSPGSTFKVLASFAPALDSAGKTLATVYNDAPFCYDDGTPINNWYTTGYKGICSIRYAIEQSLNIIAVKNLTVITPQLGYDYLLNFGFTTITDGEMIKGRFYTDVRQPLALGGLTHGTSPYELNAAYAAIANQGVYVEPKLYTRVLDSDGNVILDNTAPNSHRVIKETTAFLLTDAMVDVVTIGNGTMTRFDDNMAIAGKTGTSTEYVDVWFAGFTPYYTGTVWTGYDNNVGMNNNAPNKETDCSKKIWAAVMKRVHENLPRAQFPTPPDIVQIEICSKSGKLPVPGLCDATTRTEYFEQGTEPTESCTIHYRGNICAYDHLPASPDCPFTYEGEGSFPLAEEEALISGSTVIMENEDGSQTILSTPVTRTYCHHDAAFFADPNYEAILSQEQWQLNGGSDDDD
ncbi:MAG: transglycosylase domain-containing protein [Bacteroidales bacterium]|nr:transglycosylase domain-containing protein [Lachnoclostridium sp.]MCM1383246.1 transglycosylase domain-containing protein [Lachnoclostridium sp.]MCM1465734.1 transglycosylase domain-containing protein [Bacteroidales bacterium]